MAPHLEHVTLTVFRRSADGRVVVCDEGDFVAVPPGLDPP